VTTAAKGVATLKTARCFLHCGRGSDVASSEEVRAREVGNLCIMIARNTMKESFESVDSFETGKKETPRAKPSARLWIASPRVRGIASFSFEAPEEVLVVGVSIWENPDVERGRPCSTSSSPSSASNSISEGRDGLIFDIDTEPPEAGE